MREFSLISADGDEVYRFEAQFNYWDNEFIKHDGVVYRRFQYSVRNGPHIYREVVAAEAPLL